MPKKCNEIFPGRLFRCRYTFYRNAFRSSNLILVINKPTNGHRQTSNSSAEINIMIMQLSKLCTKRCLVRKNNNNSKIQENSSIGSGFLSSIMSLELTFTFGGFQRTTSKWRISVNKLKKMQGCDVWPQPPKKEQQCLGAKQIRGVSLLVAYQQRIDLPELKGRDK